MGILSRLNDWKFPYITLKFWSVWGRLKVSFLQFPEKPTPYSGQRDQIAFQMSLFSVMVDCIATKYKSDHPYSNTMLAYTLKDFKNAKKWKLLFFEPRTFLSSLTS